MSALIWQCVRDNHAFLKKGRGPKTLSAETGNITNIHNNKFSGLSGKKVAGMTLVTKNGKSKIVLASKNPSGKAACPNKAFTLTGVSKCARKGANCIAKNMSVYRPDLVAAADAKYQKIRRTFRARK